jgi:Fur family transcriptional regulator, stress-responsive regulator
MKTPDELTQLFRANGRKVTAQRQCIFRVLQGDVTHPSAEAVFEAARRDVETISLKTVYQTLNDLSELGEILSLDVGTGMTRFDPNVDDAHHHVVCRRCGKVRDVYADFPDISLPDGSDLGFEVGSAEIIFRGLCAECVATGSDSDGTASAGTASAGTASAEIEAAVGNATARFSGAAATTATVAATAGSQSRNRALAVSTNGPSGQ